MLKIQADPYIHFYGWIEEIIMMAVTLLAEENEIHTDPIKLGGSHVFQDPSCNNVKLI